MILVNVLSSWMRHRPHNILFNFVFDVTEPPLRLIKKIIPGIGGIDISPIILVFGLDFIRSILLRILLAAV